MAYITCENLSLGYENETILEGLNFQVHQGEYLCIVGENGTGKSTLIKTILNLQKPKEGEILLGDGLLQSEIGYLPQQTLVQKDFPATVYEVVISGTLSRLGRKPFYGKKEKEMARKTLEELGMWELRKRSYRKLSGGQQQRVLLARAMCATSKVIVLDEPVTGLDPKVTAELYDLIHEVNQKGMTILMVSHDLQALSYATHVLHLAKDTCFFGTVEAYEEHEMGKRFLKEGGKQA
ncbi:MAG: metal ABC transporter ATP-binding protein [Lachnospiraceae bacterium]|nr:metal ABC transporter ATP-binding protein [Lachnospiraceae bacterium]